MEQKNLDDPITTIKRKKIIKSKPLLRDIYKNYYKIIYSSLSSVNKKGKIIELGSGAGFIKQFIPHAITSDILKLPGIDFQFSALKIPFKKSTVHAFVMIDVFHHMSNVEKFLQEANRCLKRNGQIIMIEPAGTVFSKFINKNFHHEPFNENSTWSFNSSGPLSGANTALAWIVFFRDKRKFKKKFPQLEITLIEPHTPIKYLISGGFSYPQLLPTSLLSTINKIEIMLRPFNKYLGLFYTIVLTKK